MQTTSLLLVVTVDGRYNVFPTKDPKLQVNTCQKSELVRNADSIVAGGVGVVDDGGGDGATAAARKTPSYLLTYTAADGAAHCYCRSLAKRLT